MSDLLKKLEEKFKNQEGSILQDIIESLEVFNKYQFNSKAKAKEIKKE